MAQRLEAEVVVVGAGVIGLAIAERLSRRFSSVLVLERNPRFGLETSSRNSEVVHGGLYYPMGSLKARLCLEGAALLFDRCARLNIPLIKRGKLVVALDSEQEEELVKLENNASDCGARDLELWSSSKLRKLEPRIPAVSAIYSPWTAVIDAYELMRSFIVRARHRGVDFAFKHEVVALEKARSSWRVEVRGPDGELLELSSPLVINASGLGASRLAASAGLDLDAKGYRLYPSKGDYFSLSGRASHGLHRLIYPLPDPNVQSLGVHLTVDVGGQARLGPDATFLDGEPDAQSYRIDERKLDAFLKAGQRLLPWLERDDLSAERCGIRPKISGPDEPQRDFVIVHENSAGAEGLINLIGIDSPGLTSSPAIAREVERILDRDGLSSRL